MNFKITYHSFWVKDQIFYTDSTLEVDELVFFGKQSQYKVTVEEVD